MGNPKSPSAGKLSFPLLSVQERMKHWRRSEQNGFFEWLQLRTILPWHVLSNTLSSSGTSCSSSPASFLLLFSQSTVPPPEKNKMGKAQFSLTSLLSFFFIPPLLMHLLRNLSARIQWFLTLKCGRRPFSVRLPLFLIFFIFLDDISFSSQTKKAKS